MEVLEFIDKIKILITLFTLKMFDFLLSSVNLTRSSRSKSKASSTT